MAIKKRKATVKRKKRVVNANPTIKTASGWIRAKAVKIVNGKLLIKR